MCSAFHVIVVEKLCSPATAPVVSATSSVVPTLPSTSGRERTVALPTKVKAFDNRPVELSGLVTLTETVSGMLAGVVHEIRDVDSTVTS